LDKRKVTAEKLDDVGASYKQPPGSFCACSVFRMECQKPQLTQQQNSDNYTHTKFELCKISVLKTEAEETGITDGFKND
jgi:hypothetical protein